MVGMVGAGVVNVQADEVDDLEGMLDTLCNTYYGLTSTVLPGCEDYVEEDDTPPATGECPCTFTRALYPGVERGDDVLCLQTYLNDTGYTLAASGAGSPGNETTYYGSLTRAAVKEWQDAKGVSYGAWWGYFGPISQAAYDATCAPVVPVCDDYEAETTCEAADCYWYDDVCNEDEEPIVCADYDVEADCPGTCYWYDDVCNEDAPACDTYDVEADCPGTCYWYSDACNQALPDVEADCTAGGYYWYSDACHVDEQVAGALEVKLNDSTPVTATVPANATAAAANVAITKVDFVAGDEAVTITGLKVTRSGLSQDAALSAVKLFDGSLQVGNSQSLGSSHQANFSNISIAVPANTTKTLTLAATMTASAAYNGNIIYLGIASADDVTTTADVVGTFPVVGNGMTLTSGVTIGTAVLYNGASGSRNTTDLTVDPTEADVRFTQVKIMAGSAEGLAISQITAIKNGTAATADVKDIKLVNDTTGVTLGTVSSLDSNGRAVFSNLNISVAKGGFVELSILASMNNSGAGRTIAFDLHDGVAYTIDIEGATYGFGITPTRSNFCAAAGTCTAQTINQGYLTVQKSASTPATGYIALGGNSVSLAAFDFTAGGEGVNVTSTQVTLTPSAGGSAVDYTNVMGYDGDGNALFGPQDATTVGANTAQTLTFTDAYSLPVGTTIVYIKANVSSSSAATEAVQVSLPANTITARGATSGKVTYTTSAAPYTVPPSTAATANVMTILGPALTVTTAATPIAGNVVEGAQNEVFANFNLDASASGEDIRVTALTVTDTLGGGATLYTALQNLELWQDGVKLETSNSTATNANTVAFTFKTPVQVSAGLSTSLQLQADITSLGTAGDTHAFKIAIATDVTSAGWSTGTTFTETVGGIGQAQTIQTAGRLKVEVGADRPQQAQFVAGSTGNAMMSYKLTASYEPINITNFFVATTASAIADISKVKVYVDGVALGNPAGYGLNASGVATIPLTVGMLTVPKDDYVVLDIKVDLSAKTQLTDADTLEIGLGDATGTDTTWGAAGAYSAGSYLISATGGSSGTTITPACINSTSDDGVGTAAGCSAAGAGNIAASYVQYLYDGVLTVGLATGSPSGTQVAGPGKEVLRLSLTATGDDITINDIEFVVAGTCTVNGTAVTTLVSEDGNTTYESWAAAAGLNLSDFNVSVDGGAAWTKALQIASGTTKVIKLKGDTSGCVSTNTLSVSLDAPTAAFGTIAGIEWQNASANNVDSALTKILPVVGGGLSY